MTLKIKAGIGWVGALFAGFLNACGGSKLGFPAPEAAPEGSARLSVSYLDPTSGNAEVAVDNVSAFPGVGLFNLTLNCTGTATADYVFKIKNTGTGALTGLGTSPITLTLLDTTAPKGSLGDLGSYGFTLVQAPVFPIEPGDSSTFTVRLNSNVDANNSGASACGLGWVTPTGGAFGESAGTVHFRLSIQTNDATHADYSTDFTVWGNS